MSGYPKTMVHPHAVPARLSRGAYENSPARFPPVTVNTADQEEEHRAKGYITFGETVSMSSYQEYPKMMMHPRHVDAVPGTVEAVRQNGQVLEIKTPGTPEAFPHVVVKDEAEELEWLDKGYVASKSDPQAIRDAVASPYVPGRVFQEYPKMVDGKIVDPNAGKGGFQKYPMWVGDVIVQDEDEHRARAPQDFPDETPVPLIAAQERRGPGRPRKEA